MSSFQVTKLNTGCAVTIYASDTITDEPCSATVVEVAERYKCYNSSWVYYSIDGCTGSGDDSDSSSGSSGSNHIDVGKIVGGVVGGVAGVAVICGLMLWFFLSRRRQKAPVQSPVQPLEYQTQGQNHGQAQSWRQPPIVELANIPQAVKDNKLTQHHELHGSSVVELQDSQADTQHRG
ncbi:hypothetical protein MW887_007516 [Aspergillus wentii]|nr:hypothetical protein MW887_007516 [Aspergillus wentii]